MIFVTHMESTPNPDALKYILNERVLVNGVCQYTSGAEARDDLSRAPHKSVSYFAGGMSTGAIVVMPAPDQG